MNRPLRIPSCVIALMLTAVAVAAEPDDGVLAELDTQLAVAGTFQMGQASDSLAKIEQIVFTLPKDSALRVPVEQRLVGALETAETADAKSFLCRQLRVMGTARCVPSLEKLLPDARLSHMAVYALGYLEAPEAAEALQRALKVTSGQIQVGIINALADRHYQPAAADLLPLLTATAEPSSPDVLRATIRALGKLGDPSIAQSLLHARTKLDASYSLTIDQALLDCASQLIQAGENQEATAIYETLASSDRQIPLQLAALRGRIAAGDPRAAQGLAAAIQSDNPQLARGAIELSGLLTGASATKMLVDLLASLPLPLRPLLIQTLGKRGDSVAAPALAVAAVSEDEGARLAALAALGQAGTADSVIALAKAAATQQPGAEIARASLVLLPADGVDAQLLKLLDNAATGVRIEVIRALAGRQTAGAAARLLAVAANADPAVRAAAIEALGAVAAPADLPALVKLILSPEDAGDRPHLEAATGKLLPRIADPEHRAAPLLEVWRSAPAGAQPTLLHLLGQTGAARALEVILTNLDSADHTRQQAAVQALTAWPDTRATAALMRLFRTTGNAEFKQAALQALIRLAQQADDPNAVLVTILKQLDRIGDQKLVLAQIGLSGDSRATLELTLDYLDQPELGPTAGLAALRIAYRIRQSHPEQARSALARVIATVDHADVQQRAREVLNDLDKYAGHILTWVAAGPYQLEGKDGEAVFRTPFPPEQADAQDVEWVEVTKGVGSWDINLEATFGGRDHCGAYMRTRVWSPSDQDALLEVGSDDGVKAWLNGKLVLEQWVHRGAAPRQDRAPIRLQKGWNQLMLKVVDYEGGWVAACRVRAPDGSALDGLKYEAP